MDDRLRDRRQLAAVAGRSKAVQGGGDRLRAQGDELPRRLQAGVGVLGGFQLMKRLLQLRRDGPGPEDQRPKLSSDQHRADQGDQEGHQGEEGVNGAAIGVRPSVRPPVAQRRGKLPRRVGNGRFPFGDGIRPEVGGFARGWHLDRANAAGTEGGLPRRAGRHQVAAFRTYDPAHVLQCTAGGRHRPAPWRVRPPKKLRPWRALPPHPAPSPGIDRRLVKGEGRNCWPAT